MKAGSRTERERPRSAGERGKLGLQSAVIGFQLFQKFREIGGFQLGTMLGDGRFPRAPQIRNRIAFSATRGNGFNIQIETLPLDGRITLRIASEKSE